MKKNLIIALAGIMMFAFAQCGGNGAQGLGARGSKEYQNAFKHFKKVEEMIMKAKTCADLDSASEFFYEYESIDYAEEDQMTQAENELLVKQLKRIDSIFDEKEDKLCD